MESKFKNHIINIILSIALISFLYTSQINRKLSIIFDYHFLWIQRSNIEHFVFFFGFIVLLITLFFIIGDIIYKDRKYIMVAGILITFGFSLFLSFLGEFNLTSLSISHHNHIITDLLGIFSGFFYIFYYYS